MSGNIIPFPRIINYQHISDFWFLAIERMPSIDDRITFINDAENIGVMDSEMARDFRSAFSMPAKSEEK